MHVANFTEGATDPLREFRAQRARFVPLADGDGDTHVSCLYLDAGAQISDPPSSHDCALLIVHGELIYSSEPTAPRLQALAGMGLVIKAGERFTLESPKGAIVVLIESDLLAANERGISTPERIRGQRWPGDSDGRGGTYTYPRGHVVDPSGAASPSLMADRSIHS